MEQSEMEQLKPESERYADLSRHFIEKADEYLLVDDRVQASEKGWGAVAEAFKCIAEGRGWNHQSHRLLNDVAYQLSDEWSRSDVQSMFDAVEKLHVNFYEDAMELDEIELRIGTAKALMAELEILRERPQEPITIQNRSQRNRWRRLMGELLPLEGGE